MITSACPAVVVRKAYRLDFTQPVRANPAHSMVVPNYHCMVESMKGSDLILPLPGIVVEHISLKALGLATFEFPLSLPSIDAFQAWHPRRDTDPVHRWLRETLFRVSRQVLGAYTQ